MVEQSTASFHSTDSLHCPFQGHNLVHSHPNYIHLYLEGKFVLQLHFASSWQVLGASRISVQIIVAAECSSPSARRHPYLVMVGTSWHRLKDSSQIIINVTSKHRLSESLKEYASRFCTILSWVLFPSCSFYRLHLSYLSLYPT